MSFHDNREGWTNVAGVVASLVAAYFSFGTSAAAEAAGGAAFAEGAGALSGAAAASSAGTAATYAAAGTAAGGAASYGTYAAMAAQALGGVAAVSSSLNQHGSAEYNAQMGVSQAQMASMQAGAAEDASRRKSDLLLGEQRAAMAQSGVDPSSGTGLLVQEQSARNAEMDALNIRYAGLVQGRGLLAQSELDTRQAQIYGQNAGIAGMNAALSTYGSYQAGKGNYLRQRNLGGVGGYNSFGNGT